MNTDPLRRRAIAALILVNLLWGISFPLMKMTNLLIERHQPLDRSRESSAVEQLIAEVTAASFFMTLRFSIALVLLAVLIPRLFRGITLREWLMGAATGLGFAGGFMLQVMALNHIPASRSGFLTSLAVVFTPLLMIVVERRRPRGAVVAGAAVALVGTAILTGLCELGGIAGLRLASNAADRVGAGDWLTVLAAFVFAVQIISIDIFSRRMAPAKLTPGMFLATWFVGIGLFASGASLSPSPGDLATWGNLMADMPFLGLTLVSSLFCTVVAFYCMNKYQPYVSPAHAALIYTLEPLFATVWAMLLPGLVSPLVGLDYQSERLSWGLLLGGLLVIGGNALALWPQRSGAASDHRATATGQSVSL